MEKKRAYKREYGKARTAKRNADPEVIKTREQREHLSKLRKMTIAELEVLAESDSDAALVLEKRRAKNEICNRKNAERRKAEREAHPEKYPVRKVLTEEGKKEKQKIYSKKSQLRRKQQYAELKEKAKADPEAEYDEYAAKKLQKHDERQKKYNAMRRDKQVAE